MLNSVLTRIFGSRNERVLRQLDKSVAKINALETQYQALSDSELRGKTDEFRKRLAEGATLDSVLVEAFATVREASRRVLGMRHHDVQLVGGMVLHMGRIAEMRTGEGKTLVATLPVYLNALAGKGVHVVTVNDYLAKRDSAWMGKVYGFLGMSVGVVWPGMEHGDKRGAYEADITYGTNNEFGFDYLRDNMALDKAQRYQRGLNFAIVDEVDSILIDEARTPLIISGPSDESPQLYVKVNRIVPRLTRQASEPKIGEPPVPGDFWVDEKQKQVHLSEEGMEHAEQQLRKEGVIGPDEGLYDSQHIAVVHHLNAALRANAIYQRDVDYIVRDGEVIIVDEFTGRTLPGRRWSEGLHQAVEAKERVAIQAENQTLASITFQNYFRMYGKLSGMTGTADTEAYEFHQIYALETVVVPTSRPMIRKDQNDKVYRTMKEKHDAITADIKDCVERGQPVLVGTTSIENSELLSDMLTRAKLPHNVLNAKQHAREAEIVAEAGRPGVITIATNMAGRGTDIVLGGNVEKPVSLIREDESLSDAEKDARIAALRDEWKLRHEQVLKAGGLKIIGTERHESRRIDNQLRGRSGRQGDPGESRFYLSLEDPLMKIFAGERLNAIMVRLKMPEGEAIEAGMVTRSLETAQRKVEQRNFDMRKQLLEYDDVSNDQRKVIYQQRNELLETSDITETITAMREGVLHDLFRIYVPLDSVEEQWDIPGLELALESDYQIKLPVGEWVKAEPTIGDGDILQRLLDAGAQAYADKIALVDANAWHGFERNVMLQSLDTHWREHLSALDHLR
ncbi:MAG: preprotein translocase subunit SecA, partial [Dokdonella sp.]|nr:preprotein translocase subunit SecA [Dokdonella sp.]